MFLHHAYKTKVSSPKKWSVEDDNILWENYSNGASYKKLMKLLNCGYGGIKIRLAKLKQINL
jgi:hypothetical protein